MPLRMAVIEGQDKTPEFIASADSVDGYDLRVSALTSASQDFLSDLGAWSLIESQRLCAFHGMDVWDAEGTGRIEFDARDIQQTALGHIVENRIILASLYQQMAQKRNVHLIQPAKLAGISELTEAPNDKRYEIALDNGDKYKAGLLIGADGGQSEVRRLASIETRDWDYGHNALVATVRTALPHQHIARQRFLKQGPLAFLPVASTMHAQHFCTIVWSAERDYSDRLYALADEEFCHTLGEAFEWRLGAIEAVSKRARFPLRQSHAVDYVKPGLALIADAAHTIHPLAGQGINLGLQDARVLAEEVALAVNRGLPVGSLAVLQRYQRRRKGANLLMMGVMEGFKRLFSERNLAVRWARNTGMTGFNQIPILKNQIMKQAMGL
jgi:2-octaprenylphenol hydroxylase